MAAWMAAVSSLTPSPFARKSFTFTTGMEDVWARAHEAKSSNNTVPDANRIFPVYRPAIGRWAGRGLPSRSRADRCFWRNLADRFRDSLKKTRHEGHQARLHNGSPDRRTESRGPAKFWGLCSDRSACSTRSCAAAGWVYRAMRQKGLGSRSPSLQPSHGPRNRGPEKLMALSVQVNAIRTRRFDD